MKDQILSSLCKLSSILFNGKSQGLLVERQKMTELDPVSVVTHFHSFLRLNEGCDKMNFILCLTFGKKFHFSRFQWPVWSGLNTCLLQKLQHVSASKEQELRAVSSSKWVQTLPSNVLPLYSVQHVLGGERPQQQSKQDFKTWEVQDRSFCFRR